MKKLTAIALSMFLVASVEAKVPQGHLVIIGGGAITRSVHQAMIDLAGGTNAVMLAITSAGGASGPKAGEGFVKSFSPKVASAKWAQPTREQSDDPKYVEELLKGVTGIFFSGGQQVRIVDAHRGTLLHRKLLEMYENGAMISGSSAGAAMMSDPMITGKDLAQKNVSKNAPKATSKPQDDEPPAMPFKSIAKGRVELVKGMGFVKNAIIDQHFMKRSRGNRLFSVALAHPGYTCFGIDEDTAIVVSKGNQVKALGRSNVMVIKAESPKTIKNNRQGDYGARNLKIDLLLEGDTTEIR